ncbi:MAG TPA: DinB family protein [Vicinamibacteria bacterium]|jgi:uncharacterized damage-inducible protein DinB
MDHAEQLSRLFAYNRWANREALGAARASAPALRLLAHVAGAERLWLARLRGEPSPLAVWPELGADACAAALQEVGQAWRDYLAALAPGDVARAVAYVNSRGEPWSSTVGDVLMHVVLHSSYHRGQAALAVRQDGATPAYTDYIHCVRQGFLD